MAEYRRSIPTEYHHSINETAINNRSTHESVNVT